MNMADNEMLLLIAAVNYNGILDPVMDYVY